MILEILKSDQTDTKKEVKLISIEELKIRFQLSKSVFAGVKATNRWAEGKQLSVDDFNKAVEAWKKMPIYKNVKI